jgi:type 1 glutamine amidotransferase
VLATTMFDSTDYTMPVACKRTYGRGSVFYCSLGCAAAELDVPEALTVMIRGMP